MIQPIQSKIDAGQPLDPVEHLQRLLAAGKFECPKGLIKWFHLGPPNVDDDGTGIGAGDPDHQNQTSLPGLNADKDPYSVIPGGVGPRHDIPLGSLMIVIDGATGKVAWSFYGDVGPRFEMGEVAIATAEELGFEREANGRIINEGLPDCIWYFVLPEIVGSDRSVAAVKAQCAPYWAALIS